MKPNERAAHAHRVLAAPGVGGDMLRLCARIVPRDGVFGKP